MTMTMIPSAPSPAPETPRSLEVLVHVARTEAPCWRCHTWPGVPCKRQGRRGVHLGRLVQAYALYLITAAELSAVIRDLPVCDYYRFGMAKIIRAGAR